MSETIHIDLPEDALTYGEDEDFGRAIRKEIASGRDRLNRRAEERNLPTPVDVTRIEIDLR